MTPGGTTWGSTTICGELVRRTGVLWCCVSDGLVPVADHLQVPARRESGILASEDHRPRHRIARELIQVLLQLQGQPRTQRIKTVGIGKTENYPFALTLLCISLRRRLYSSDVSGRPRTVERAG
jgi:hypothetical protein